MDDVDCEFHILERLDGVPILSVVGSADYWAAQAFSDALTQAEAASRRGLIVCLERATYFGAAAFAALNDVAQRVAATGVRHVIVICPSDHIASRVLRLLKFKYRTVDTLAAALLVIRCSSSVEAFHAPASATRGFRDVLVRELG